MGAELALSTVNERRLGALSGALEEGRPGQLFRFAKWAVRVGLALRFAPRRGAADHSASALYLLAGAGVPLRLGGGGQGVRARRRGGRADGAHAIGITCRRCCCSPSASGSRSS
jgi:hypothetical protein